MDKIKVVLYRHKFFDDIYLARNWNYCGGSKNTPFYFATQEIVRAINDAQNPKFLEWAHRIEGLTAKFTDSKEVNIDGYEGIIKKELSFPVADFHLVELVEI